MNCTLLLMFLKLFYKFRIPMFCSQRDIPTIEFYIHSEMVELGAYNNLLGSNSYLVLRGTYIYTIT